MKGVWKILSIVLGVFVGLCVFIVVAAVFFGTDEKDTTISADSTTSVSSLPSTEHTLELTDLSNNFYEYVQAYGKIPNENGSKTEVWEEVKGSNVEWSGKVIDSSDDRLYVIADRKYKDGLTWSEVSDTKLAYYVFIAKFEDSMNIPNYSIGDQVTISGNLDSRGDKNLHYNWDITNSSIN